MERPKKHKRVWRQAFFPLTALVGVQAVVFVVAVRSLNLLPAAVISVLAGVAAAYFLSFIIVRDGEAQRKHDFERNRHLDRLTGLLSHSAFLQKGEQMIKRRPDCCGLVVYFDTDDLKFMNNRFGHDVGDDYIRKAAECVNMFAEHGAITARVSGDELVAFLYGFESKKALWDQFNETYAKIGRQRFSAPDGISNKVRMSVGLAFYPDHGDTLDRLVRHADFAMFEVKTTHKGSFKEFDEAAYHEKAFLLEKKHLLNQIIERNLVKYAFQPIVEIKTGEIHAFEALMRPQLDEMQSPLQVLKLAQAQSKLYQIEVMTLNNLMRWMKGHQAELHGRRLFINSIPNQILKGRDLDEFCTQYAAFFSSAVFELTENEYTDSSMMEAKQSLIHQQGAKVALDDFGSGYSNEMTLLNHAPEYLKIDMGIIRGIDTDPDRQRLLSNIVAYAKIKHIGVIAEGCETYEEVEKLCELGVDYLQGYYIAKPQFDLVEIPLETSCMLRSLYRKYSVAS